MPRITYRVTPLTLTDKAVFKEASAIELRVLLALIERGGMLESEDALAALADTTRSRVLAALLLWEEEGVITRTPCEENGVIIEEFTTRTPEVTVEAKRTAATVRDERLAEMLEELAALMNKPALSTEEIKAVTEMYITHGVTAEYIVTLAAGIAKSGRLGTARLGRELAKLVENKCETLEQLETYLKSKETESQTEWEMRHVLGIYNRTLSATEKKYFKRWIEEYGFAAPIIARAYDITVIHSSKLSYPYMDRILKGWFDAGCKTLADCDEFTEREKSKPKTENKPRTKEKTEAQVPRHGSFNIDDAFNKALARSFTSDDEE